MAIWRRSWFQWSGEILLFVIVCWTAWRLVEDRVTRGDDYIAMPEDFVVTQAPQWIRSDVKRQVLQNASMNNGVSILDENLVRRVAEAFPMHPWIEGVSRVRKEHPAKVTVDVVYRKPVAMVDVPGGVYAVDVHGVVLPSEDFIGEEAARYPRIAQISMPPKGQVGEAWGDVYVESSCRLAALLQEQWNEWSLARIVPTNTNSAGVPNFDIITQSGGKIAWGAAPTLESLQTPQGDSRIERMTQIAKERGSLDLQPTEQLNLTGASAEAIRQAQNPDTTGNSR